MHETCLNLQVKTQSIDIASRMLAKLLNAVKISFVLIPYLTVYLIFCYVKAFIKLFDFRRKSLAGETILLIGCGTGIGRQLAIRLASRYKNQINLILWDYNTATLQETAELVQKSGTNKVFVHTVDISSEDQVRFAAETVKQDVGDVTILINNAALSPHRDFLDISPQDIEACWRVNFLSHFRTIKEFLPGMIESNKGHIIATCSMGGHVAVRGNVAYYATKFALRGSMTAIKEEFHERFPDKDGVSFSTVYPWFVKTPLLDNLDVRFRFPRLTPLMEPDYAAKKILDGIEARREHIFVPTSYQLLLWLLRFVPEKARIRILDFFVVEYRGIWDTALTNKEDI